MYRVVENSKICYNKHVINDKLGDVKMEYKNPSIALPSVPKAKKNKLPDIGTKYTEIDKAYFVFIDVLGFKDTFTNGNVKANIRKVFEYFNLLVSKMRFLEDKESICYAGQTSDSLYFYTDNLSYLIRFVNIFLHFNMFAMSQKVYFRGGISTGTLFVNMPHQFFGECVIKSYSLEENIANFPRIAFDKATRNKFKTIPDGWDFEDDVQSDRCYLNPFSKAVTKDITDDLGTTDVDLHDINLELITDIQKKIASNKNEYEFNDKLYRKYSYLLKKCDGLIKTLKEFE